MKQHGKFWIVSVHVLTTGLLAPAVSLVAVAAVQTLWHTDYSSSPQGTWLDSVDIMPPMSTREILLNAMPAMGFLASILLMGTAGGTCLSLKFLKRHTTKDWVGCTIPSIVAFSIWDAVIWLALCPVFGTLGAWGPAGCALYFLEVIVVFGTMTSKGFRKLQETNRANT